MDNIENTLSAFLNRVSLSNKVEKELVDALYQIVVIKEYPAGSILLKPGAYCKDIFIIQNGFARRYTLNDGKDITLEFAKENEMITSTYSIITRQPSLDYVEVLEDSVVLKLRTEQINELYKTSKSSLVIGRLLRDKYLLQQEKRILSLQVSSTKERYLNLIKNQPYLLQRASLGQIASYLGIAQETLSRLRKKI